MPPPVAVRGSGLNSEDVAGRHLRHGPLDVPFGVPVEHDESATGRAGERLDGRQVRRVALIALMAAQAECVDRRTSGDCRRRRLGDPRRRWRQQASRKQRHHLAARDLLERQDQRSQRAEAAAGCRQFCVGCPFPHTDERRAFCDLRPLGVRDPGVGIGRHDRVGPPCQVVGGDGAGRDRPPGDTRQHLARGRPLGGQLQQGVGSGRDRDHRDAVVDAEPIEEGPCGLYGYPLVAAWQRRLVHDDHHVPPWLGDMHDAAVAARLPRRGVGGGARAAADALHPEDRPVAAVNVDGEVGRAQALDQPAVAIQHEHVDGYRRGVSLGGHLFRASDRSGPC